MAYWPERLSDMATQKVRAGWLFKASSALITYIDYGVTLRVFAQEASICLTTDSGIGT